jgi:hypothetical protein
MKAYEAGEIVEETALIYSTHKTKMRRDIEMSNKLKFEFTEESSGLQMAAG